MGIDELINKNKKRIKKNNLLGTREITVHAESDLKLVNEMLKEFNGELEQLKQSLPPKQEKVEVPELIDAWIKHVRALNWGFYDLINPQYSNSHTARDIETWLESDKLNAELLAKAWFADDYIVYGLKKYSDGRINVAVYARGDLGKSLNSRLTEQEIKSVDERYWEFAIPVEEEAE